MNEPCMANEARPERHTRFAMVRRGVSLMQYAIINGPWASCARDEMLLGGSRLEHLPQLVANLSK